MLLKFCSDCKYYQKHWKNYLPLYSDSSLDSCVHPYNGIDMVTGSVRRKTCHEERISEDQHCCGDSGKFFKDRNDNT